MTINEIKAIIKENNVNKDIKWSVKRTENGFEISNDYCGVCKFTIEQCSKEYEDGTEYYIVCRDNQTGDYAGLFSKGTERWDDYAEDDAGLAMAAKSVVKHFYYYYYY